MKHRWLLCRSLTAFAVVTAILAAGLDGRVVAQTASSGSNGVLANLWEWNWPSVAQECKSVLGPDGYAGVLVGPPQDSYASPGHEWWDVYQPADYNLTSRMGNETQFKDMVSTCRGAGVKVYVDAVINHMTADASAVSYGGEHFTKYDYPGLYTPADFHHYPADCPEPDGSIHDFNDFREVTKCELGGLADLRTESDYVRDTIAGYLNKLIGDGVSGFRVDSAKHIGQTDLAAIESRLHTTADGTPPYMGLEVAPGSSGDLTPAAFESVGKPLGFDYAAALSQDVVTRLASLHGLNEQGGLAPSNGEMVFVENHDTERGNIISTLNYKSGQLNILATVFMLAWNYGTPVVFASFTWNDQNQPPPSDANGFVSNTDCAHGWACTDRNRAVAHMVAWHNVVGDAPVSHWYSNKKNLIAFSRGNKGWIALNNESKVQTKTFSTGLPRGKYCDIIHGTYSKGKCVGPTVKVDARGKVKVTIRIKDAVAFDTAGKVK